MRAELMTGITPAEYYDGRHARGWMQTWPEAKKQRILSLIRQAGLPVRARVLEFGCGEGVFAGAVRAAMPDVEVHACDISGIGIAKARRRFPGVAFHWLGEDDSTLGGDYDLVFSHHVLEHVQDVDESLSFIAGLLKPRGKALHIVPCGNPGSLEFRLSRMIDDKPGPHGLFPIDDISHVRRLASAELEELSRRYGLTLREVAFANQFWGGLDYLTAIHHGIVLDWLRTFARSGRTGSPWLVLALAGTMVASLIRNGPRYVLSTYDHPRPLWKRVLYTAAVPFAALTAPLSWIVNASLAAAAEREWRVARSRPNGAEAYLLFEKD